MVTVPPATLERTPDGTPWSPDFGDAYHSAQGGLGQARHVFLQGNGLPERWQGRRTFTVLETGFGLGLNFLATWLAWREDPRRARTLHFVSTESRPFAAGDLRDALAQFTELSPLTEALAGAWPLPLEGFHRIAFEGGRVVLTLILGDARASLPRLTARADALYLDGFAPARNPELWSPEVLRELARLVRPGGTLATWTVAGRVRAALGDVGFEVDKREGFGHKREMLSGRRLGEPEAEATAPRRMLVVGGGLAGTLVAERLADRGIEVALLEARPARSMSAVGLLRPIANLKDALNARASRAAFLHALRHFASLQAEGQPLRWHPCGVLQLADDAEEAERFDAIVRAHGYPAELLRCVDAAEARDRAGRPVRGPGWWFPSGSWVIPGTLAQASDARAGESITRYGELRVEGLKRTPDGWQALAAGGVPYAEAEGIVLANAADAARLVPQARLRLSAVRGQVTYLPPDPARRLDVIVSGSGYVAPVGEGICIGASYRHDDPDPAVRDEDHRENFTRAESMLPGFTRGLEPAGLAGWTGFRTTVPDRLPVFGAADEPGLWLATGLGSRGLLWGPLGAELLASQVAGEPWPLPADLAGAMSPRRFLS